jgi:hypothetical protein
MSRGARAGSETAARKADLVAASALLRRDLAVQFAPVRDLDASAARLGARVASVLRQPVVIGGLVFVLVAVGPRRLFGVLRWAAFALPLHPIGRRLVSAVGARLLGKLAGSGFGRSGR